MLSNDVKCRTKLWADVKSVRCFNILQSWSTKTSLAFATFLFSFHDVLQPLVPCDALHAIGAFEVQSFEASCFSSFLESSVMALFRRGFWLCSSVLLLMAISHSQWQGFVGVSGRMDRRRCQTGSRDSVLDVMKRFAKPMVSGDERLEIGSLVGYRLKDLPGAFWHTGIYVGPGDEQLRNLTGNHDLHPDLHYVIEYSGPTRQSGSPASRQSRSPGLKSGKGEQNIWITEMKSSDEWFVFDISSNQYGGPYSGQEMKNRALSQIQTPFGGYDVLRNNCQHFAAWARYGVKKMLLDDEGKGTLSRHVAGMGAFATAGILGSGGLAMVVWGLCAVNILTATTGGISGRRLSFRNWGGRWQDKLFSFGLQHQQSCREQQHELCAGFKQYLCRLKPPVVQPLPVPLIHMFEETRSPEPWFLMVFDAPVWSRVLGF